MRRRDVLMVLAAGAVAPAPVWAQASWRRVAVPLYGPEDFVRGFVRGHALPRARAWQKACGTLAEAMAHAQADSGPRGVDEARSAWKAAALAWAAVSAVATGPLVSRRSARRIDFQPVRPALVLRAIDAAPGGADAMDRVGSAAKGLGALEWLLWAPDAPRNDAARAYAREVANDLRGEADAVADAFAALAERELDDDAIAASFAEIVNQWIGGLEQLRMQRLVRPVQDARTRNARGPVLLRPWSGIDADDRAARWQALRALSVFAGADAPPRGQGLLVPIETNLRGRGLNALADRLRQGVLTADASLRAAGGNQSAAMGRAANAIERVKRLSEAELAAALQVRLSFSDADGD